MDKPKPSYTLAGNTRYIVSNLWRFDRRTLLLYLATIPIAVATPFSSILMARLIVGYVDAGSATGELIGCVCAVTAGLAALTWLKSRTQSLVWWSADGAQNQYISEINMKRMSMDYEILISKEGQRLLARAKGATSHWGAAANRSVGVLSELAANLAGFFLYGGVIFAVNPWIILLLAASSGVNYYALKRVRAYERDARARYSPLDAKLAYIIARSSDLANAKDIRLYNMHDWLQDMFVFFKNERYTWFRRTSLRALLAKAADAVMLLLRDGAGYAVLIYMAVAGKLTAADFVFYFGAITGFSSWLSGIINKVSEYQTMSLDISDLRAFLDMPDRANHGAGREIQGLPAAELRLENVSYRYPGGERDVIRGVSFTVRAGERLALVGENGAGKTTLISLMCGLLTPTAGRVLLNGVDIREYNIDEYQSLFSAVFQNIEFLPLSIAENIALEVNGVDRARLASCLASAGLADKVASLPKGADTLLVRSVNPEATELSGGERQRLALARALYKDAPMLLLDEPTAALDPIAESEIYARYAALTCGKTSIYISHRLASTRFCDRIAFLTNGAIAECGSHDELMNSGGGYARMYEIQSRYYRRQELERRAF